MAVFDATPLSPSATSFADMAHWRGSGSGLTPLKITTNANGDSEINAAPGVMALASSRAAMHGNAEGDWFYFVPDGALITIDGRYQGEWIAADDQPDAINKGLDEVVKFFLNYATRLLDSLDALDGEVVRERSRQVRGELTVIAATQQIEAPAALNAFQWIAEGNVEMVEFTGFDNAGNNGDFFVQSVDIDADPQVLTLADADELTDETQSDAAIYYLYAPALSLPRKGLRKGKTVFPDTLIPKAFKDATCVLARYLMNSDLFKSASSRKGLKGVKIGADLAVNFTDESDFLLANNVKAYLPDEVLQLIEFALTENIRGYGSKTVTGSTPTTTFSKLRIT